MTINVFIYTALDKSKGNVMEKIENTENESTCKHTECLCARPADGDYCSPWCESAAAAGTIGICECGHAECED